MNKEIEIPEGYEARIEGNKVIIKPIDSEKEKMENVFIKLLKESIFGNINGYKKEQKPEELSDKELQKYQNELYNFKVFAARQAKEHHILFLHDFEWNNFCEGLFSYFNEKQKPINECNTHEPTLDEARKWNEAYEKGYFLGYENGRNEQKSAEWSEEEERSLNIIIDILDREEHNGHLMRDSIKACVKLLKSLRPQQKQEWSERDKYILNNIHDFIKENTINPNRENCAKECLMWLDSLLERGNLLPRQEWSEDYCDEDLRTRFAFYTYKDEDNVLYLSNVFVEETSRNKGFGTKILAAAEKVAETIGATNIRLKVKQDSLANAWYRKHGYNHMSVEDGYDWLEKTLEYLKPIKSEWSEEGKEIISSAVYWLKRYLSDSQALDIGARDCRWTVEQTLNKLKSLRPQPKQEWSEGEMKMLNSIIDDYEAAAKSFCGYEGKIMFLKAIRNGEYGLSKQEWSEKDERHKQAIIDAIQIVMEECGDAESIGKYEEDINWFELFYNKLKNS